MRGSHLAGKAVPKLIAAITLGLGLVAYSPKLGNATIMANHWTSVYTGGGYTAVTVALRSADVGVDTYWSSGIYGGGDWKYVNGTTYVSVDGHASPCIGSYSVSTEHSAYEPSTGDYDWASSGGSGSC